ncbi:hypothetical protein SAMN05216299_106143 [Nitrosospira sp. Nsp14]|nr:hypothetical protein SAMN05216299_106143 [Nitrosospira sp. Nsp14]
MFEHAAGSGNVAFTCRHFGISRETYYICAATYHFGQVRISWYLARYHDIRISAGGVYKVSKRQGLNRLPDRQRKQVPGHHVQVDVKFLDLKTQEGHKIRYFQYTAIDDATRIRALKIYEGIRSRTRSTL